MYLCLVVCVCVSRSVSKVLVLITEVNQQEANSLIGPVAR